MYDRYIFQQPEKAGDGSSVSSVAVGIDNTSWKLPLAIGQSADLLTI